jgi:hypothetical protein
VLELHWLLNAFVLWWVKGLLCCHTGPWFVGIVSVLFIFQQTHIVPQVSFGIMPHHSIHELKLPYYHITNYYPYQTFYILVIFYYFLQGV